MCASSECEAQNNIEAMEAFCNERGGAPAAVLALCQSTFTDRKPSETYVSIPRNCHKRSNSGVRRLCRRTNFGYDAATCGDAAAAAAASFPTCDSISADGLAVCSSLTAALVPADGQTAGMGCALLANTIGESVGMATEAVGAFQNAANSDNMEAMCLESGDP